MRRKQSAGMSFANSVSRLRIWIMMAVLLVAIGLFQASSAQDAIALNSQDLRNVDTTANQFEHRKPKVVSDLQRTIDTGMHIKNIYQLNLRDKTFWADGWYWIKWRPEIQRTIAADKIPLDQIMEFTNQIETTNMVTDVDTSEPVKLDDGRLYQLFRFSGHFYLDDLNLARFPFYDMNLPITMETRPDALSCYEGGPPCVSLLPDKDVSNTLIGQFASINGYDLVGSLVKQFLHQYNTTFGVGNPSAFPSIDFGIIFRTNFGSAFGQYILPLLVVIGIVIASPSLPSSLGDSRLAIPSTALLTLIFLQQSYRADLPALSYMTYLDFLYIYAYLLSVVFFLLFCWGNVYYNNASEGAEALAAQNIDRIDLRFQIAALISLALLASLAYLLL